MRMVRVIPAALMAVIPISDAQWGTVLEDGVVTGLSLEEIGGIHTINRSGGNEGRKVEEGEQKKETSVDRHSVWWEIQTNGRGDTVRRGRTGLGRSVVVERACLNRQREQDGIRK